ncbi:hypothetical protein V6N13_113658 [Hibiscus sabdariffa]|uniref:Secreted protein n=1 Tax=Hibiscus sabdariffa TaxID=183260 RepID=A0ABR2TZH2_9ROSI
MILLKSSEVSKLAVAFLLISFGYVECKCGDRHGGDKRIMCVPLGAEMRVQATSEEVAGTGCYYSSRCYIRIRARVVKEEVHYSAWLFPVHMQLSSRVETFSWFGSHLWCFRWE